MGQGTSTASKTSVGLVSLGWGRVELALGSGLVLRLEIGLMIGLLLVRC